MIVLLYTHLPVLSLLSEDAPLVELDTPPRRYGL